MNSLIVRLSGTLANCSASITYGGRTKFVTFGSGSPIAWALRSSNPTTKKICYLGDSRLSYAYLIA